MYWHLPKRKGDQRNAEEMTELVAGVAVVGGVRQDLVVEGFHVNRLCRGPGPRKRQTGQPWHRSSSSSVAASPSSQGSASSYLPFYWRRGGGCPAGWPRWWLPAGWFSSPFPGRRCRTGS